MTMMTTKMTQW